ncbi:MAG: hypothetical protein R3310_13635 [Candidatus Competibacteraceae bacterium]|nr:hypothetical protein [Candidatus Competibacteraceae bacterium]
MTRVSHESFTARLNQELQHHPQVQSRNLDLRVVHDENGYHLAGKDAEGNAGIFAEVWLRASEKYDFGKLL